MGMLLQKLRQRVEVAAEKCTSMMRAVSGRLCLRLNIFCYLRSDRFTEVTWGFSLNVHAFEFEKDRCF